MLIGRKREQHILKEAFESDESKFVAIYGRRRVGKTYLVRETFNYEFSFYHSGMYDKNTRYQLQSFQSSIREYGYKKAPLPKNWIEAFDLLKELLKNSCKKKKVVFIDEIPWMDAQRSSFLPAFEHFWNSWASARKDILLIICGSATSWIVNKVIKNRGGLHNRVTNQIALEPFTLNECDQYAKSLHLGMNHKMVLQGYMVLGGVPYYWSKLEKGLSLAQNIDQMFFSRNGELRDEFNALYSSLYKNPQPYMNIITALGEKKIGMTRQEIIEETGLGNNGKMTDLLESLESCGFIHKYNELGKRTKDSLYQLIDNFTLFYFKFMKNRRNSDEHYWSKSMGKPEYNNWCGLAFERICLLHTRQIKKKLGISGVITSEFSWVFKGDQQDHGVQIDLLIDRSDDVINLCEMKYYKAAYSVSDSDIETFEERRDILIRKTHTNKAVHITMITSNGLVNNSNAMEIQSQVTMEDLFEG